jgi:hypothetical protein
MAAPLATWITPCRDRALRAKRGSIAHGRLCWCCRNASAAGRDLLFKIRTGCYAGTGRIKARGDPPGEGGHKVRRREDRRNGRLYAAGPCAPTMLRDATCEQKTIGSFLELAPRAKEAYPQTMDCLVKGKENPT